MYGTSLPYVTSSMLGQASENLLASKNLLRLKWRLVEPLVLLAKCDIITDYVIYAVAKHLAFRLVVAINIS